MQEDNKIISTDEQLQMLLAYWQKALRLQDWIVKCKISRKHGLSIKNSSGTCHWTITTKLATITLLDPIDYPVDTMHPQDMEQILVHELLHLHFAPFDDESDTPKEIAIEQATDCIAWALVNTNRGVSNG